MKRGADSPGGELDQLVGEDAGQTWCAHIYSETQSVWQRLQSKISSTSTSGRNLRDSTLREAVDVQSE